MTPHLMVSFSVPLLLTPAFLLLAAASGCSDRPTTAGQHGSRPSSDRAGHGRAIYRTGVSPSGSPVSARLSAEGDAVPAALLACANCHGRDGVGVAEGGMTPATITWDELTRAYGPSDPSLRRRPAYDERSVGRAITMGLDPSGRPLDPSMPRYALGRDDLDDLVAYLRRLGRDPDPGLTDVSIVVGTILPPPGADGGMGGAVKSILAAYFGDVNRRGGVYGRRVEVRWHEAPGPAEEPGEDARRFLQGEEVFALVAPFIAGAEDEIEAAARSSGVPVLGPFTAGRGPGAAFNRFVFHLHPGLADQANALVVFARSRFPAAPPPAAVVVSEADASAREAAGQVRASAENAGWEEVELVAIGPDDEPGACADRLKARGVGVVFVLSPGGLTVVAPRGSEGNGWEPLVFVPGALAGPEILDTAPARGGRLFLSFPTLPEDQTPQGAAEYERLGAGQGQAEGHRASRIAALAAARCFVDAMTSAGRGASREKLIEQLERFYRRPTGLTRPITYGPNRRLGSRGAYVVAVDPLKRKLVPVSGFIEPPAR